VIGAIFKIVGLARERRPVGSIPMLRRDEIYLKFQRVKSFFLAFFCAMR
jgi:hypothetical protein